MRRLPDADVEYVDLGEVRVQNPPVKEVLRRGRGSGRKGRGESGSVLVEFSLVIVPFLALMFLTMDVAWVLFGWASLQEGVREGVRWGVTGQLLAPNTGLDSSIKQMVNLCSFGFAPTTRVQYFSPLTMAEVTGQPGATTGGNLIKVTSTITLKSLMPIWQTNNRVAAWPVNLTAASSDVMEESAGASPPEYP